VPGRGTRVRPGKLRNAIGFSHAASGLREALQVRLCKRTYVARMKRSEIRGRAYRQIASASSQFERDRRYLLRRGANRPLHYLSPYFEGVLRSLFGSGPTPSVAAMR